MTLRSPCSMVPLATLLVVLSTVPLVAQEPLDRARQLRDAGRFATAADTVRAYLADHPDDAGARWLLGQLLHWRGEHAAAHQEYREARALGLDDPWFRLEHASVLLALEEWDAAAEILGEVAEGEAPEARLQARTLLGTLAYWDGDLATAARRFEAILDEHPDHAEARRQLGEIRELTRPWIGARLEYLDDNQPFRRIPFTLEGGAFLNPLWSVAAGGTPRMTDAATTETSANGWVGLRGFVPELDLDVSARGGGAWAGGSTRGGSTWTGRGELALRLPADVKLRATAERQRYLWTRTSADTLLVNESLEMALDRSEAAGWAGKAGYIREAFPDENTVTTAYAWLLAPVRPWLRVGYAFSWSDAEESTWNGHYDPYFTPEEMTVHSLLAELSGPLGSGTARLSGEWGFAAEEMAPVLTFSDVLVGATTLEFFARDFTPWSLSASWTARLGGSVTFDGRLEHRRTAFYRLTRLEAGVVYYFSD